MNDASIRLAVAGLVGIAGLCVVGMVAVEVFGHGGANLVAPLCGLAGTSLGILGTLLLPSGRLPGGNGSGPVVTPAATPGLSVQPVPVQLGGGVPAPPGAGTGTQTGT